MQHYEQQLRQYKAFYGKALSAEIENKNGKPDNIKDHPNLAAHSTEHMATCKHNRRHHDEQHLGEQHLGEQHPGERAAQGARAGAR